MERLRLREVVERLEKLHGAPSQPPSRDPWELILRENVAYLADDERREAAFRTLERRVGTKPDRILAASDAALLEVAGHGILAKTFAEKLRRCADLALREFGGDLSQVLAWRLPEAKRALGRFPGIGEPGAEKILLFARAHPVLALESNGLRVLVRLGFAREQSSYSTTYRLVRAALVPELARKKSAFDDLIAAHQLLRRHGQRICRRSAPLCGSCPLLASCPEGRRRAAG
jgi:endonuclease III